MNTTRVNVSHALFKTPKHLAPIDTGQLYLKIFRFFGQLVEVALLMHPP